MGSLQGLELLACCTTLVWVTRLAPIRHFTGPPSCWALHCRREYVLPDGLTDTWGHVRTEEEAAMAAAAARQQQRQGGPQLPKQPVLQVNNERFMVPEAIFHPSGGWGCCVCCACSAVVDVQRCALLRCVGGLLRPCLPKPAGSNPQLARLPSFHNLPACHPAVLMQTSAWRKRGLQRR